MITTEKFYLFDVGVANYLARRQPKIGSPEFGKAFEHYILMELKAYQAYRNPDWPITFWRTSTGREVDFLLGDKELAIEIKGSSRVHEGDIGGLQALLEDGPVKKCCIVCLEKQPRRLAKNIEVIPWPQFIEQLWAGEFKIEYDAKGWPPLRPRAAVDQAVAMLSTVERPQVNEPNKVPFTLMAQPEQPERKSAFWPGSPGQNMAGNDSRTWSFC